MVAGDQIVGFVPAGIDTESTDQSVAWVDSSGNLNKFNILKNSCATVALRAWNAAVGTRNGKDTSYKLVSASDGIFKYMDAPKGVRDNIRNRLPGYYLNNAEGVAEPGAGYQDDTGWVYVSAPEPEPQPDSEPAVMTGDVNNDGVIDIMDSILVQKYTSDEAELTPEQLEAADVNGDGSIDVLDAMDIQKYASDKISEFSKKA